MDKKLLLHYKQLMHHDRSRFAQALDTFAMGLIFFLSATIFCSQTLRSWWQGAVLAALATALFFLCISYYNNCRLVRFIKKKRIKLCTAFQLEQMVLISQEDYVRLVSSFLGSKGYETILIADGVLITQTNDEIVPAFPVQNHPSYEIGPQDILDMYRIAKRHGSKSILIVSTAPVSQDARAFAEKLQLDCRILRRESLVSFGEQLGILPGIAEMEEQLLHSLKKKRTQWEDLKRIIFSHQKSKAYAIAGIALMIAAFVLRLHLYYSAIGMLCFMFSALCWHLDFQKEKKPTI